MILWQPWLPSLLKLSVLDKNNGMVSTSEPPHPKRSNRKSVRGATPPAAQPDLTEPSSGSRQGSFPIVGIGASAGGLEAFRLLLQSLPADTGAAFVLVQHLSPTHESILPALLARSTAMPVGEALDVEKIEPDHVYVIPSHMDLAITDGHLKLLPRTTAPERHMPIDLFFRTLAEVRGSQAIGVVLSGTGSDGTLGLKAIKAGGGICLAQDPQSAAFDGMPRSSIAAGCVDAVLPPDGLAREIARLAGDSYLREPGDVSTHEGLLEAERAALEAIFVELRKVTGKDLAGYKKPTLLRRIRRRMALRQMGGIADYARHLASDPAEAQDLYQDLLINVTSFFRNPEIFAALRQDLFPRLLKDRAADAPIRVWVPGCSTGEEAYSLAICLLESLDDVAAGPPPHPDLRHRRPRRRRRQGAGRDLPGEHRLRRLTRAAGALLRQSGRHLPGQQDGPRPLRLRPPRPDSRPTLFPSRPDQLPQRPHLPGARACSGG